MTKIAINGLGRIGRPALKKIIDKKNGLELVAVNDLTDPETLAHLIKYDSIYGTYGKEVELKGDGLVISGRKIKVFNELDPVKLPWKELDVDIVLECSGHFSDFDGAVKHLEAGAKRVIISAPSKNPDKIKTFIPGVNAEFFSAKEDLIVDMGSCTTNCLAPVVKVLNDNLRIKKGFMTTVHSYTNDQKILDLPHKDLRRARAAALNIIPTTTGAAKTIGKVIPELKGKMEGIAFRVPTPTVSVLDFICQVGKETSKEEVNLLFERAAEKDLKGILGIEKRPLVSSDFKGNSMSAVLDAELTMVEEDMVKVVAWYDNEFAYAQRLVEFAEYIGKKI